MKNVHGVWLPDHEEHLLGFASGEGWTYQKHKLDKAMGYCDRRGLAIDVGGHCGLWSRHLTELFDQVVAFEPIPEHRECYLQNVAGNFTLHPYGLGNREMKAAMHTSQGSSGDSWIRPGSDIEVKKLDSFELAPDFIKIDTEGFEYFVIMGGENTIRTHKPVMIVEQKPGKGSGFMLSDTAAIDLLLKWGYELREVMAGDYILTCNS